MKILAVAAQFDRSEASMLVALQKSGFEVATVSEGQGRYDHIFDDYIKERYFLRFKSRFDVIAIWKLRAIVKKSNPAILHLFSARAVSNALIATYAFSVKLVAYRGTMGHLNWFDPSSHLSFLNQRINKIICVSHAVERYLHSVGISQDKTVTIYKGHDRSWYIGASSSTIRNQLSLPSTATVIGCVANIRPVKGIDILIQAFASLAMHPQLYLLLVGNIRDPRIEDLIRKAPNKKNIICTGFRSDALAAVSLCNIFVMPSVAREGLPKALIEAMSLGIAPIVTDVGGMPEVVHHMVHGIVVPPADEIALTGAINLLLTDKELREAFSKIGPIRIEEHFNIKSTVQKTANLYMSLLSS